MSSMRRVVVYPDRIAVETVERPVPEADEVLVRALFAGVCGSDVHAAHGRHPFVPPPYRPGHEVVGVVEDVASAGGSLDVGQRVTLEPYLPCWTCKMCRTGRPNLCEQLRFFGCGYDQGAMADFFTVPADRLHAVPDSLSDHAAVLVEPLATPVHAIGLGGDVGARTVVVLGAGTIGLLAVAVLRTRHPARIVVTDPLADKRERAVRLGATAAFDPGTGDVVGSVRGALGESADVVFDCVGTESSLEQAIALADKGGTVVVVGVPAREVSIPLPIIQDHQIRIQGSATYLPDDFAESMRLLGSGDIVAADFVTAVRPLERAADAFALAASGEHVKVLVSIGA